MAFLVSSFSGACFANDWRNFEVPMDARQLTALTTDQLIALALAVVCEFARHLSVPLTVSADMGDTSADGTPAPSTGAVASTGHASGATPSTTPPWTATSPSTPTGPSRPNQCCFGCGVPGCSDYCAATSPHDRHRCAYHSWY